MTAEDKGSPVFLGCLIVHKVHPRAEPQNDLMYRYRGVDRWNLYEGYMDTEGNPLGGYLSEASEKLRGIEDIFEFIINPSKAMEICRFLRSKDLDYDVIGCEIDLPTLENLLSLPAVGLLGHEPDDEERQALDDAIKRLHTRPTSPPWESLGFDVAVFCRDFFSIIFEELSHGREIVEKMRGYIDLLNKNGLFRTRGQASRCLDKYMNLPVGEDVCPVHLEYNFVVYNILAPNLAL